MDDWDTTGSDEEVVDNRSSDEIPEWNEWFGPEQEEKDTTKEYKAMCIPCIGWEQEIRRVRCMKARVIWDCVQ